MTTPRAAEMLSILGRGEIHGSVVLTRDEFAAVQRLYGYRVETSSDKHALRFHQAGADRNAFRHAEADGLRLLAWLARHVPSGEDPLKTLVRLAADAGCDVDPADVGWADGEQEERPQ
jgi:hypothetical protein